MAVDREFDEKQLSESSQGTGSQNQTGPAGENPENNIDNLVSSFLAELKDLSSKTNQNGKAEANPERTPETIDTKIPPPVQLENEAPSKSAAKTNQHGKAEANPEHTPETIDTKIPPPVQLENEAPAKSTEASPKTIVDLKDIDDEIEKSLIELERLKSAPPPPQTHSLPNRQPESRRPAKSYASESLGPARKEAPSPPKKTHPIPAKTPLTADPEEQVWNSLEVFRENLTAPWIIRHKQEAIWTAVLIVAMGITVISLFFLFRNMDSPDVPIRKATPESSQPDPASATGAILSTHPERAPALTNEKKSSKPANHSGGARSKRNKSGTAAKAAARVKDAGNSRSGATDRNSPSENGDVVWAEAVSCPTQLRDAANQALMVWKFKPASVEGVNMPGKARTAIAINFE
jgi:hypothetical protein